MSKYLSEFYSRNLTDECIDDKALSFENYFGNLVEVFGETGNDENLHIGQVVVNIGGNIYIINDKGIREIQGESTGRGTSVFLQFHSEHGPIYESHYQFHKGFTYKTTKKIAERTFDDENMDRIKTSDKTPLEAIGSFDIWRD